MKSHFVVMCMVLLIKPRVQSIAKEMLHKHSSRVLSFDYNVNKEGVNVNNAYDLIVSYGVLDVTNSVALRLAANSIDVIGESNIDFLLWLMLKLIRLSNMSIKFLQIVNLIITCLWTHYLCLTWNANTRKSDCGMRTH